MNERSVDIAVIGAGSAGLTALHTAKKAGAQGLLIEQGPYGTTCARVGCMPSKLLIAAASAAQHVRDAQAFGIGAGAPEIDGRAVMARVRALRDRFVDNVLDGVERLPAGEKLRGHAKFDGDNRLLVDGDGRTVAITAQRIVIATGSSAIVPKAFEGARHITSGDVFDWHDLPDSIAVFGAGIIGLELGQALARLGVSVRLFGKGGLVGPLTDPAVLAAAREHFQSVLDFVPDHSLISVQGSDTDVSVRYTVEGREFSSTFADCLVAVGRAPNVGGLNLGSTSLQLDENGVPQFDRSTGQCGQAPVFIAGDAMDDDPLLHEAVSTGRSTGANASLDEPLPQKRFVGLSIVFCEPQIAMVGETHRDLTARGAAFQTGTLDWSEQGRAIVMDEAAGRLAVYAQTGTGKLLGAEMFGPRSEHLSHLFALALTRGLTAREMLESPIYHPTFEEGLKTALTDCLAQLGQGDAPLLHGLSSGPGG